MIRQAKTDSLVRVARTDASIIRLLRIQDYDLEHWESLDFRRAGTAADLTIDDEVG